MDNIERAQVQITYNKAKDENLVSLLVSQLRHHGFQNISVIDYREFSPTSLNDFDLLINTAPQHRANLNHILVDRLDVLDEQTTEFTEPELDPSTISPWIDIGLDSRRLILKSQDHQDSPTKEAQVFPFIPGITACPNCISEDHSSYFNTHHVPRTLEDLLNMSSFQVQNELNFSPPFDPKTFIELVFQKAEDNGLKFNLGGVTWPAVQAYYWRKFQEIECPPFVCSIAVGIAALQAYKIVGNFGEIGLTRIRYLSEAPIIELQSPDVKHDCLCQESKGLHIVVAPSMTLKEFIYNLENNDRIPLKHVQSMLFLSGQILFLSGPALIQTSISDTELLSDYAGDSEYINVCGFEEPYERRPIYIRFFNLWRYLKPLFVLRKKEEGFFHEEVFPLDVFKLLVKQYLFDSILQNRFWIRRV